MNMNDDILAGVKKPLAFTGLSSEAMDYLIPMTVVGAIAGAMFGVRFGNYALLACLGGVAAFMCVFVIAHILSFLSSAMGGGVKFELDCDDESVMGDLDAMKIGSNYNTDFCYKINS